MRRYFFGEYRLNRLARRMQSGEETAAEDLYRELAGKVFGFCLSRVRQKPLAEDLTQDIFLKLVSRIETFDPKKGTFSVWFWQLARNTLFDYYRGQKEISFIDLADGETGEIELLKTDGPEALVEQRLEWRKLDEFLKSLTTAEQELFRLRYLAELSYREISAILNKPEGALRVSVSRLKRKVKQNFKD